MLGMGGSRDTRVRPVADLDEAPNLWPCPALEAAAHRLSQAVRLEEGGDSSEASLPAAVVLSHSPQGCCRRQGSLQIM